MISLTEGKIELAAKNISLASGYENLIALTEEGLIEKRKDPSGGEPCFYVEAVADDMKLPSYCEKKD